MLIVAREPRESAAPRATPAMDGHCWSRRCTAKTRRDAFAATSALIMPFVQTGILLKGENASETWDPENMKNDDSDIPNENYGVDQKLLVKMVRFSPFWSHFSVFRGFFFSTDL